MLAMSVGPAPVPVIGEGEPEYAVQTVRVGGVHGFGVVSPSGKVAGSPALDQSIARLGASTPDHACPFDSVETNSNIEIGGKDANNRVSFTSVLRRRYFAS